MDFYWSSIHPLSPSVAARAIAYLLPPLSAPSKTIVQAFPPRSQPIPYHTIRFHSVVLQLDGSHANEPLKAT